jgi:cell division GTPase FtsZ
VATINTGSSGSEATVALAGIDVSGCRGDPGLGWALASDCREEIEALVAGYSAVIAVAGLGGGTGAGAIPIVAECAKARGALAISVVSIPMSFEAGRRERALSQLREVVRISDRTLVMDMDRLKDAGGGPLPIRTAISMTDELMAIAISRLVNILNGPFISIFDERAYTMAFARSGDPAKAAEAALGIPLYDAGPVQGKTVASPDGPLSASDAEQVSMLISGVSGRVPEIVPHCSKGDGIMLFIPIPSRILLS